ncbi:hypothetical protein J6590_007169 [Homalodisca vitripennis]|nr:hypothetical protein J6590_007169 [Homalodisca vitripennis]
MPGVCSMTKSRACFCVPTSVGYPSSLHPSHNGRAGAGSGCWARARRGPHVGQRSVPDRSDGATLADMMRLFKRRCSDPSPQLVSLSPLSQEEEAEGSKPRQTRSGQASPARTPVSGSPKAHRKGRRSRSNVRRATSRANRTDDQQDTENDNSRIGMAHLRSTVNQNEVDRQRTSSGTSITTSASPGKGN